MKKESHKEYCIRQLGKRRYNKFLRILKIGRTERAAIKELLYYVRNGYEDRIFLEHGRGTDN